MAKFYFKNTCITCFSETETTAVNVALVKVSAHQMSRRLIVPALGFIADRLPTKFYRQISGQIECRGSMQNKCQNFRQQKRRKVLIEQA
jgi:hypothetical protein